MSTPPEVYEERLRELAAVVARLGGPSGASPADVHGPFGPVKSIHMALANGVAIRQCGITEEPWPADADYGPLEAAWFAHESALQEAEDLEHERSLDLADRLAGPCDLCRSQELPLAIVGSEALCPDCAPEGRIAQVCVEFGEVERATAHPDGRPESDTTHTVMLAILAERQEAPEARLVRYLDKISLVGARLRDRHAVQAGLLAESYPEFATSVGDLFAKACAAAELASHDGHPVRASRRLRGGR